MKHSLVLPAASGLVLCLTLILLGTGRHPVASAQQNPRQSPTPSGGTSAIRPPAPEFQRLLTDHRYGVSFYTERRLPRLRPPKVVVFDEGLVKDLIEDVEPELAEIWIDGQQHVIPRKTAESFELDLPGIVAGVRYDFEVKVWDATGQLLLLHWAQPYTWIP